MEQETVAGEAVSMDTTEKPELEVSEKVKVPGQSDKVTAISELQESPAVEGQDTETATPGGAADSPIKLLPPSIQTQLKPAARPKIPVSLESLSMVESPDEGLTYDFNIQFVNNLTTDAVSEGKLVVSKMHGLLFGGSKHVQIPFKCIRWFCKTVLTVHEHCFVLSYEDNDLNTISFIFFVCHELDIQLVEKILTWKLAETDGSSAMKTKEERDQVLKILQEQPSELGTVRLRVTPKEASNMNGETPLTNIMVLDLECVSFFEGSTDRPAHQIKFWVEEGENVVETIKVMQTNSKIEIETSKTYFVIVNASLHVTNILKRMRAREKHLFLDIENLLKVVDYAPTGLQPSQNVDQPGRFNLPATISHWNESTNPTPPSADSKIELEMKDALNSLGHEEEFQLQWVVMSSELEQLLTLGAIQETEIQSGGLDPNNEDHLERALTDAGDQLKDSPDLALSRIQAARKLFGTSTRTCIQKVFLYEDMELLKMLYYRSLVK